MSNDLNITLIDRLDKTIEQISIQRPNTYQELLLTLKAKLSKMPKFYSIFYKSPSNKEVEIHSNEEYKLSENTLFIRKLDVNDLTISLFSRNFNKLSAEKQDELTQKYSCLICLLMIKEENPYYCYVCQKLFHQKCLKLWEKEKIGKKKKLSCPNCRNELPLNEWKQKLNFESTRMHDAVILNELSKNTLSFEKYKEKTSNILKGIINKLNEMHAKINPEANVKLSHLANELNSDPTQLPLDDISKEVPEELESLTEFVRSKEIMVKRDRKKGQVNDFHLVYLTRDADTYNIFGNDFVKNNKDSIELFINGKRCYLTNCYKFQKGKNTVIMIVKKKLKYLAHMFHQCTSLQNIDDLQYLEIDEVKDLSYMFYNCSSLSNIQALEKWKTDHVTDFSYLFHGCTSLSNLAPISNWNTSSATNFSHIFHNCSSLMALDEIKNWSVDKATNLSHMFSHTSIKSVYPCKFWNVKNCTNFSGMFEKCPIIGLQAIQKWDVSNGEDFSEMFRECKSLKDVRSLVSWNVSKGKHFNNMFSKCQSLFGLDALKKWKISSSQFNSLK
jgi:surface protein